jgi:WhiB family redox-sensing transcriptional regulator
MPRREDDVPATRTRMLSRPLQGEKHRFVGGVLVVHVADLSSAAGEWRPRCGDTDSEESLLIAATAGATNRACPGCDMRTECLEYTLAHDERFGIDGAGSNELRRGLSAG